MIEPLAADLFAGALAHGLADVVARTVGVERVQPHEHRVLILRLELRLTVDRPGKVPVLGAVLDRDDAAGRDLALARVAVADVDDVPDDLLVRRGDGRAHPVGGVHVGAELVRVAVFAVLGLRSDVLPHIPALALAVLDAGKVGRVGLVAVAGGIGAAAVRDEHEIVLNEIERLLLAVLHVNDGLGDSLIAVLFDDDVLHVHAVLDAHAVGFKILHEREDHALVLVVLREAQRAEVGQTVDMVDVAAEIALHLQRARPALEGEHRLPVQPEVRAPEALGQHLGDLLVLKILLRRQKELRERHGGGLVESEFLVGMGVLAAVDARAAERVVGVVLVEPVVFVKHRYVRRLDARHIAEYVPHDLEMVVHLAAAAHVKALGDVAVAVATAAGKLVLFEKMDVLALHLAVADEIEGRGQTGETGADDIGGFAVDALRLFGVGEGFIRSGRVIHNIDLL